MDFEQWYKRWVNSDQCKAGQYEHARAAFTAGQQVQREVISDEKLVISRIKLLIENYEDDSEELPEKILDIVNAAIRRGGV